MLQVLAAVITKLSEQNRLCPVLCDLMKIILKNGQDILTDRHGADKLTLPRIDQRVFDKVIFYLKLFLLQY